MTDRRSLIVFMYDCPRSRLEAQGDHERIADGSRSVGRTTTLMIEAWIGVLWLSTENSTECDGWRSDGTLAGGSGGLPLPLVASGVTGSLLFRNR